MPKTSTKAGRWDHDLRRQLKRENGRGWGVVEQSGKVKLSYRYEDGSRSSVMLDIPWGVSSSTAIQNEVGVLRARMFESGMGLRQVHEQAKAIEGQLRGHGVVVESINWDEIANRFLGSRNDNRKNTIRPTAVRIAKALETLKTKPRPTDGPALMRAYAQAHFHKCPSGGVGRKRHLSDVGAMLRFAVERCGAPQRWLPLSGGQLAELVGGTERSIGDEITPPVKPEQLGQLLDAIADSGDQGLWMAVALVGCFGLRPSELAVLSINENDLYVGGAVKRNPHTKKRSAATRARLAIALEIQGRNDGAHALELLGSGIPFPRQLATQIEKAKNGEDCLKAVGGKFALYLNATPCWKRLVSTTIGLTPYSLRHGYAWRCHKSPERPISVRESAALLGHSPQTHYKYYGQWTDEAGLRDAVRRAQGATHSQSISSTTPNGQTITA